MAGGGSIAFYVAGPSMPSLTRGSISLPAGRRHTRQCLRYPLANNTLAPRCRTEKPQSPNSRDSALPALTSDSGVKMRPGAPACGDRKSEIADFRLCVFRSQVARTAGVAVRVFSLNELCVASFIATKRVFPRSGCASWIGEEPQTSKAEHVARITDSVVRDFS